MLKHDYGGSFMALGTDTDTLPKDNLNKEMTFFE